MPQLKVSLSIGLANSKQEDVIDIDDEEWNACETDEQREELMHAYWKDWANDFIDGSSTLVE